MVAPDDGAPLESRPPLLEDLLTIGRALNERGARYVVVGGMAVIHAGFVRATEDIDLRGAPGRAVRVGGLSRLSGGDRCVRALARLGPRRAPSRP